MLISYGATVGHDATIGSFVSVMPGAHVSGEVRIEDLVVVGAGAVVVEGRTVGENARVGAGAVVTRDVSPGATVVGVPVIATDIRGCRQVVEHQRTGLLVKRKDPDELAAAIGTLVADRNLRARMGRAGHSKATRALDHRRQIELTLKVYDELRRQRRGR